MKYLIISLWGLTTCYAQNIAKDTLHLDQVVITKSRKAKPKVATANYRSFCTYTSNAAFMSPVITLVDRLPPGNLNKITFFFNTETSSGQEPVNFQDQEVELLFYHVNDDNTPGNVIEHASKIIHVSKDHRGKFPVDVSDLAVYNPGRIFIGLRLLSAERKFEWNFHIACICDEFNNYVSLIKRRETDDWTRAPGLGAIKMLITSIE